MRKSAYIDTDQRAKNRVVGQRLAHRQMVAETALYEARHTNLATDKESSVVSEDRQTGQRLTANQFMKRLRKLNKDLVLLPHPVQKGIANLYLEVGDQRIHLMPCEGDWMPEWSIMGVGEVRVPDDAKRPEGFWSKQRVPWREVKRGWRTVLARLIQKGIVPIDAVEREFGVPFNRQSWAVLTGKQQGILPI